MKINAVNCNQKNNKSRNIQSEPSFQSKVHISNGVKRRLRIEGEILERTLKSAPESIKESLGAEKFNFQKTLMGFKKTVEKITPFSTKNKLRFVVGDLGDEIYVFHQQGNKKSTYVGAIVTDEMFPNNAKLTAYRINGKIKEQY